jgi:long-chain acyl-CoA synthetase
MFDSYIRDHASWTPRATAVFLPGRQVSYAEFNADIDRFGAGLADRGISRASGVVSVAVADPYLQYLATAALSRLDVCSAPASDDRADLRLTDHAAPGAEGPPSLPLTRDWIAATLAAEPRPLPNLLRDPLALGRVMLSSGTTRVPRRVGLTWRRLEIGNHTTLHTYCSGKLGTWIPLVGIDSMMGLSLVMGAWSVGAAAANAIPMVDMAHWLETLPPGMLALTPMHLRQLLAVLPPGFRPRPQWRIICGGSLLPPAIAREARLTLTPDIRLIYGSTESGTAALGHAAGLEDTPGQVGITPAGGIVDIVDDDGTPLPDGETGEIRVRGPRMIYGYLGDPEATAERFRDGWFYSGDLGRRLPDGRLVLEGRADERMNLGGIKVMPALLEEAALACPGVRDAAAFAVPDEQGVDQAWIAVAAEPGFERDRLTPHMAAYPNLPGHRFAWIDEIPRNAMGKVDRGKLRDAVLAVTRAGAN